MAENENTPAEAGGSDALSEIDTGLGALAESVGGSSEHQVRLSDELVGGLSDDEEETNKEGGSDGQEEEKGQQEGLLGEKKEASGEDSAEKAEESTTSTPEVKMYSAVSGEDELEIPENATFKIKVDSKEVEVTLAEALRNYQGKIPWDKHYKETKEFERQLKLREQEVSSKLAESNTQMEDILATFEKNPYLAFEKIAIIKGKNPADYLPIYIAQSKKTLEELKELSDAEFKALLIQKRTEHERKQVDREREKLTKESEAQAKQREAAEADQYFAERAIEYKFTEKEIQSAVEAVKQVKGLETKKPKELADILTEYIVKVDRPFTLAETAIEKVAPTYANKQKLVTEVARLIDHSFTLDEVEEIVSSYLGEPKKTTPPAPPAQKPAKADSSASPKTAANAAGRSKEPPKKEAKAAIVEDGDDYGPFSMDEIVSWAHKMSKNAQQ